MFGMTYNNIKFTSLQRDNKVKTVDFKTIIKDTAVCKFTTYNC